MPATRPRYTDAERRKALEIFAAVNGRKDLVEKLIGEADDLPQIPVATVRKWATVSHRDDYQAIRQELQAYVRAHAADRYQAITSRAQDVIDEALRQTAEALKGGEVDPRDLPKVAKDAAVAAGVSTDKAQLLDGLPTGRVAHTGVDDLQRELASVGITVVLPEGKRPAAIDVSAREPVALPEKAEGGKP